VFRPSRTMHVVFDREVFAAVRGQDLGTVRGQPIRPLLTGFGESFTDWLFQTAMQARRDESAFSLQAGKDWSEGPGWLLVYALRWLGKARRLPPSNSHYAMAMAAQIRNPKSETRRKSESRRPIQPAHPLTQRRKDSQRFFWGKAEIGKAESRNPKARALHSVVSYFCFLLSQFQLSPRSSASRR